MHLIRETERPKVAWLQGRAHLTASMLIFRDTPMLEVVTHSRSRVGEEKVYVANKDILYVSYMDTLIFEITHQ